MAHLGVEPGSVEGVTRIWARDRSLARVHSRFTESDAQLGLAKLMAHLHGMEGVRDSSPLSSTGPTKGRTDVRPFVMFVGRGSVG